MLADIAHLVVGLMMAGMSGIFLWTDRANPGSRALAYCLLAVAFATLFTVPPELNARTVILSALLQIAEALGLFLGIEWAVRLCRAVETRTRLIAAASGLFRASQIVVIVFGVLSTGYVLIWPEIALVDPSGLVKVRGIEWAVFAPLLGTAILLSGIAILSLLVARLDPVERIRFRALIAAGPLFLLTMIINERYEPLVMALGLLIFLGGSVRYLIIQNQRGTAMRQFVSPELATQLNRRGMADTLQREKREISVLACDLRGFTAYARENDSDQVIALLEEYYAKVGDLAREYGGTVKDHAGDGVLILIGAPQRCKDFPRRAVNLAQAIQDRIRPLLQPLPGRLGLGIGVATGEATIGAIQGAGRLEYVAVGNVVNLAARLCSQAADGEVLLDAATCEEAGMGRSASARQAVAMKGYAEPVPVFALTTPLTSGVV